MKCFVDFEQIEVFKVKSLPPCPTGILRIWKILSSHPMIFLFEYYYEYTLKSQSHIKQDQKSNSYDDGK